MNKYIEMIECFHCGDADEIALMHVFEIVENCNSKEIAVCDKDYIDHYLSLYKDDHCSNEHSTHLKLFHPPETIQEVLNRAPEELGGFHIKGMNRLYNSIRKAQSL